MRAMIVDDDPAIVEVIRDEIHWDRLGVHEVRVAYNAQEARAQLMEKDADLILCDIEMPQESGLDLLAWYQNQKMKGRFLILTAHESFTYAHQALQLQAADYLLKPFRVDAVEMVLQKNIGMLQKERANVHQQAMGQWMSDHLVELKRVFYEGLLRGTILPDLDTIIENIQIRSLDILADALFRLAAIRFTAFEQDQEQYGSESLQYMISNMLAESLFGEPVSERIICYDHNEESIQFYVVFDDIPNQDAISRMETFVRKFHMLLEATVTACISQSVSLRSLREKRHQLTRVMNRKVSGYGHVYLETEEDEARGYSNQVFQMNELKTLFEERKQKQLMEVVKREIETRMRSKSLEEGTLRVIRSEYQQAAYSYLSNNGVMISWLMQDQDLISASETAGRSPIDFLRWANLLTGKVFESVESIQRSKTLIAQIDAYIQEHYAEPISRTEIGQEFHMVPEYLAKIYKKKTGKTIKDAINEYRVYKARLMLEQTDMRIIDIAMDTGFENASYFSTLFKKYTGKSPADYRRQ